MPYVHGDFPDEIWKRLKEWAKAQAHAQLSPTNAECVAQVLLIAADLTGRRDILRGDVVTFYANETAEMVLRYSAAAS